MHDPHEPNQGPIGLAADAMSLAGDLIRKEFALAKAELSRNLSRAGNAIGFIAAAAVIAIAAINVLVAALVGALAATELGPIWSAVIVGAVLALLAWLMVRKGMADLSPEALMPSRTIDNLERDARTIKEAGHGR